MSSPAQVRRHPPRPPRPRAELCQRLSLAAIRSRVEDGAPSTVLRDGSAVNLHWQPCRGTYGGGGLALLIECPRCFRRVRVLWRPPGGSWGCKQCNRISYSSQRRSGSRRGSAKPSTYQFDRVVADRCKVFLRLGLIVPDEMIPDPLLIPRRHDAPRISERREWDLRRRLLALEWLRLGASIPPLQRLLKRYGEASGEVSIDQQLRVAQRILKETAWAVRRPARDPRSRRRGQC